MYPHANLPITILIVISSCCFQFAACNGAKMLEINLLLIRNWRLLPDDLLRKNVKKNNVVIVGCRFLLVIITIPFNSVDIRVCKWHTCMYVGYAFK